MKREVDDMSGHCATRAGHATCHGRWETPSAVVTCSCECHARGVVVKKPRGTVRKSKAVVKKKMMLARADDDV